MNSDRIESRAFAYQQRDNSPYNNKGDEDNCYTQARFFFSECSFVGMADGCPVGMTDGCPVGMADGCPVGMADGCPVG